MTTAEQRKIFANNLTRILEERHLMQIEVADALGVSHQLFSAWARGKNLPRVNKIQRLADYLGVKMTDLIDPPASDLVPASRPDLDALLEAARHLAGRCVFAAFSLFLARFRKKFERSLNG